MNSACTDLPARAASGSPGIEKPPGLWSALGVVAFYFMLQAALGLLLRRATGSSWGHRNHDGAVESFEAVQGSTIDVAVTIVAVTTAAVITTLLIRRLWPGQWSRPNLPGLGLAQPESKSMYLSAILFGVAVLFVGGVITSLLIDGRDVHQAFMTLTAGSSPLMRILLAIAAMSVVPFIEELLFRGVLLSGFASRMRVQWAVASSALIFACAHLPGFEFAWYPLPQLVLVGLVLGWLRTQSNSLWPPIVMHGTMNGLAALLSLVAARPV